MDRDRESLRDEIFQLDEASQAWLASELEAHLAKSSHTQAWLQEMERRDAEWDQGDVSGIPLEDSLKKAREVVNRRK